MLKDVCDKCGRIIEGEPREREFPDVTLLVEDEVTLLFESLCPDCRSKLTALLGGSWEKPEPKPIKHEAPKVEAVVAVSKPDVPELPEKDTEEHETSPQNAAQPRTREDKELPEAVTRQFPVKMKERRAPR